MYIYPVQHGVCAEAAGGLHTWRLCPQPHDRDTMLMRRYGIFALVMYILPAMVFKLCFCACTLCTYIDFVNYFNLHKDYILARLRYNTTYTFILSISSEFLSTKNPFHTYLLNFRHPKYKMVLKKAYLQRSMRIWTGVGLNK